MTDTKAQQLEECHLMFLEICLGDLPTERAWQWVHPKITGYGTNVNEKIQSLQGFVDLLELQREESKGLDIQFAFTPVSKTMLSGQQAAVFVDEATISMQVDGSPLQLHLRISSVFEYIDDRWWAVHVHGSLPQGEVGQQDTWSANEWKQKNAELERIIRERTEALQVSMENLKATQAQLIHSEKMASLGELTAGIAHEIQNPLNFVNNFADLSRELLAELVEAATSGDPDVLPGLASELTGNLEKILHHGQRADAIVKGMLQHSRTSTGQKEPTDLNALVDEYLRLAYHGLRAKDKSFNATFTAELDPGLPKLDVVPQEIGRVLLNLINNAFYAVSKRQRQGDKDYVPIVTVRTSHSGDKVILEVTDNGPGIPDGIREKIFQPFFTTKPAGEGTGLGLSLSYDIVTKGHGGSLVVESAPGEGTVFTITLPIG